MSVSLKYAVVERERRFVVASLPLGQVESRVIVDRYITGTRLRLREGTTADGTITRKLTHKVRLSEVTTADGTITRKLTDAPSEVACTNMYLDDTEWDLLLDLPARVLRKTRHLITRDGLTIAIDELADGTLLAEIDDGDGDVIAVPAWLDVIEDVTSAEAWTGAGLAQQARAQTGPRSYD